MLDTEVPCNRERMEWVGRWWASRHERWRNQVKSLVHWKQGKNRVNAEELKKNNWDAVAWLLLGVQVSIDQCWKLTPPQSEQNPTWAQKRREKQTADTTTSQIITQFHKCLQCWTTHAKTLFFTTLSWVVLGAVPHSPGLADSHCSLQKTPSVWLGMLIQVWERNIFMCCIWDLAAKRKVLIICFHTSKQTGMVSSDFSPNEWMWIYEMRRGPVKEKEPLFCAVNHSVVLVNLKSSNTELEMIRIFSLYVQMLKSSDQRLVVIVISGPRVTCYGRRW